MEVVASLYLENQTGNIDQTLYTSRADENVIVFVSWVTHATAGQSFLATIQAQIPNTSPIFTDLSFGQNETSEEKWSAISGFMLQSSAGKNITLSVIASGIPNYDLTVALVRV